MIQYKNASQEESLKYLQLISYLNKLFKNLNFIICSFALLNRIYFYFKFKLHFSIINIFFKEDSIRKDLSKECKFLFTTTDIWWLSVALVDANLGLTGHFIVVIFKE